MDTRGIGLSIIEMKGGRITPEQSLDYATGYSEFCQIGEFVSPLQKPLAIAHVQTENQFLSAQQNLRRLVQISDKKPTLTQSVIKKIA